MFFRENLLSVFLNCNKYPAILSKRKHLYSNSISDMKYKVGVIMNRSKGLIEQQRNQINPRVEKYVVGSLIEV